MNPFDPKSLMDAWTSGVETMVKAQEQAGRALTDSLQAMAAGTMPGFHGEGTGLGDAGAELSRAGQSMSELWEAAAGLFTAMAGTLAKPGAAGRTSEAADATFASVMDPRRWLAGSGELDDVLGRMAEGPRFADLWDAERRYAKVARAWTEVRRAGLEHNAVVLQAWLAAGRRFNEAWASRGGAGGGGPDHAAALALWTEIANRELLETQRSDLFLRTQAATIRASTELRLAQQELVEHFGKQYGFPTRTELDDVHRTVTELRRELRAMRRAMAAAEPAALPRQVG